MCDEGATVVSEALRTHGGVRLRHLCLDSNWIGADGAVALAELLGVNGTLRTLSLADNDVGNDGVAAIADVLTSSNQTLASLDVSANEMGGVGLRALADTLQWNTG